MGRDSNVRLVYSTAGGVPREEPVSPGEKAPKRSRGIRLRLEKRASGRLVTLVSGLPGDDAEVSALARRLKASCAAGGTIKGDVLELQGDHREKVEKILEARGLSSRRGGGG